MDEPLYLHQPATGFPGLLPGQLVRIKKTIFGLATSPHEWSLDLQGGILRTPIHHAGKEYIFTQCPLDPCIFMVREVVNVLADLARKHEGARQRPLRDIQ